MTKILFHLGHPAHFHLFKNTINELKKAGVVILIVIKKKDVLEDLLKSEKFDYLNLLPKGRKDNKLNIAYGLLKQSYQLYLLAKKTKPDLLVGTSVSISHVGRLLKIPSLNFNEDDADVVPLYSKMAYPWANHIIAPEVCSVGKWVNKKIGYPGYHELAYLHPKNYTPSKKIADRYVNTESTYFIIRFAKLTAHHDKNIDGISFDIAAEIIQLLKSKGNVYITSERELHPSLEKYRITIDPKDIHHVMSFASIYLGDSQTMAAESGVLGVPFIRMNDFVGRISYLKELEEKYQLGYGFKPINSINAIEKLKELLLMENLKETFSERRKIMLNDKMDVAHFITWLILNYPESTKQIKENPQIYKDFK